MKSHRTASTQATASHFCSVQGGEENTVLIFVHSWLYPMSIFSVIFPLFFFYFSMAPRRPWSQPKEQRQIRAKPNASEKIDPLEKTGRAPRIAHAVTMS
jgi:hypothetical protein